MRPGAIIDLDLQGTSFSALRVYFLLMLAYNKMICFVNALARHVSAYRGKGVDLRMPSDYCAGVEHAIAAYFGIIAKYSAKLFASRFDPFVACKNRNNRFITFYV